MRARNVSGAGTAATTGDMHKPLTPSEPHREPPPSGPTVEFAVHFRTGAAGRKRLRAGHKPSPPTSLPERAPRIAKTLALALRFERLIREGFVRDYADLARLAGISRARVSQIMGLLNLAPDIQEELLFLPRTGGRDQATERALRDVVAEGDWERQRGSWSKCLRRDPMPANVSGNES